MPITVLNVAYPLAPVGPDAVGGAEQVLTAMDVALVKAGHRSLVIAQDGSQVKGELISLPSIEAPYDGEAVALIRQLCAEVIQKALRKYRVDVVHMHGIDFPSYMPPAGVPVLGTLHLPVAWYPADLFDCTRPRTYFHCVSESQNADCPPGACLLPPIRNGVELAPAQPARTRDYVLAIGRICPEKGFHLALQAARLAGVQLVLAGSVFPYQSHQQYFREELEPQIGAGLEFVGAAGKSEKQLLYAGAKCLVVASTVKETSSLVALEAMACGTPVVAFRTGALPEIITHGRNGFLVDDVRGMGRAIERASEIDPEECRETVRSRFSMERMTAQYLAAYRFCYL